MPLIDDIRTYVNLSHAFAWARASPKTPDEPGLVSALLAKEMYRGLRATLTHYIPSSCDLLVKGVFTHQTPKVKPSGSSKSVEIGDLLLVQQHFDRAGKAPVIGRAMLLQAKTALKPKTGSLYSGTQRIQFELYQSWPKFTGVSRIATAPPDYTEWDFKNASIQPEPYAAGSQYVVIFKGNAYKAANTTPTWLAKLSGGVDHGSLVANAFANESTWVTGICTPAPSTAKSGVECHTDFAECFEGLLTGRLGRGFQPGVLSGSDHWSIFVNTMLEMASNPTHSYTYTCANQNITSSMRGCDLMLQAVAPILKFSSTEDVDRWLISSPKSRSNEFNFINSLFQLVEQRERHVTPPSNFNEDTYKKFAGGHVPILVVSTIGAASETSPFMPNRLLPQG
ncbi:hypothetical protein [Pseudomonas sp. G2-4]|uniref:hypothetical protein n=1 Tax=Pseudomonas sp. G2-4 TaxID=1506334 RepID=UPI0024BBC42F|nr:hypothetical protein [Pseudomonas sp. G2-4]WHS60477.1 hypothetical protein QNH97_00095 [Pseudomonas sp. G2-4]